MSALFRLDSGENLRWIAAQHVVVEAELLVVAGRTQGPSAWPFESHVLVLHVGLTL